MTSGDLPIEFKWLFNGRPVKEIAGITTAKMGKRNSVLTIDSVSGKHAGNFTCQATNSAASVNFTSQLIVNGVQISPVCLLSYFSVGIDYLLIFVIFILCNFFKIGFSVHIQHLSTQLTFQCRSKCKQNGKEQRKVKIEIIRCVSDNLLRVLRSFFFLHVQFSFSYTGNRSVSA